MMEHPRYFYTHLIELDDLIRFIEELKLAEDDHSVLIDSVHKTVYLEVVEFILDELPVEHRQTFLLHLETKPHDHGILVFLERSIEGVEEKLQRVVERVKHDFTDALHEYKQASTEWFEGL